MRANKAMFRLFTRRAAMAIATMLLVGPTFAAGQSPSEMVEEAIELFAEKLDGNRDALAADKAQLYEVIDAILLPRFDRNAAARAVLGKHRSKASADQLERFTVAFYTTLLHRYADGLLEFKTDNIEVLEFRGDETARSANVKTIVMLNDGTKVPVNYFLANQNPGWLMLDVKIEGISYVKNFRTEIDIEIRSTSLESVIDRLEAEADLVAGE